MRLVGLVSLVALVFLLSFRPLLHHQVLVGEGAAAAAAGSGRHGRNQQQGRQHAEEWAEERKRMRWFMTRDYARARRHTPRNNRLDP
ncbi:hypothetical protein PAHAL_1G292400 [Panicum hallii]|uniref:Uncharacterized protein n=2 Tax=Panicum sect. Panicum TaxID=2100772 RepID=A0A3L6QFM4_PANMI|nr:hypothetical protein PAHAL_1G292400 [Panicum hallii]RLM79210.1 hypothetical protein C2845_PM12G19340 [Panicum miliaceum]